MESKENIMVRTMIARDPIIDATKIYQGDNYLYGKLS